ncbi:LADA_0H01970g1_1 [Lachancea dasiensis]|uniref:Sterol 3-beta-glucosyltransferase n=1 Tax=Lachancea dasiensis TaxID=1072105 RepID=A0A1G4JZJ4_9SACH|nr:LADA_0H01970g1_1 [Lachancea dasiensis]
MARKDQPDVRVYNGASSAAPESEQRPQQRRWIRSLSPVGKLYRSSAGLVHLRNRSLSVRTSNSAVSDSQESETSNSHVSKEHDHDLARPCGMAKSIVGLLTTASVYAGMGDLEQAHQTGEEEEGKEDDEEEELEDDDEEEVEELEDDDDVEGGGGEEEEEEEEGEDEQEERDNYSVFLDNNSRKKPQDGKGESVPGSPLLALQAADEADHTSDSLRSSSDLDSLANTVTHFSKKDSLFELSVVSNNDANSLSSSSSRSRRSKIYKKLLSKFNLSEDEDQFVTKYSCWLLKDLLIQGHIVLTTRHLLFFAFLPKSTGTPKMSGNLSIISGVGLSGRWTRYWSVLKDHTLSLYNSPRDLYFPLLTIDLRYANRIELAKHDEEATGHFKIHTEAKVYKFRADSGYASRSWCSALKKQLFATQNSDNDSISVKIPLSNIIDIDEQTVVAQSVTMRIRVLETPQSFAVDDYFFMFLSKKDANLKEMINRLLLDVGQSHPKKLEAERTLLSNDISLNTDLSLGREIRQNKTGLGSGKIIKRVLSPVTRVHRPSFSMSIPFNSRLPQRTKESHFSKDEEVNAPSGQGSTNKNSDLSSPEHIEAPDDGLSESDSYFGTVEDNKGRIMSLASWTPRPIKNMGSMWGAHPMHYRYNDEEMFPDDDQYLANSKEQILASQRFRSHFSLRQDEALTAAYYAHLNKNIPVYGKLYLGSSVLCFRSLLPGTKTKMILPVSDVENCYKERGFRFGYFGLVVVIHGHEELFFEFSLQSSRDDAECLILKQLDSTKAQTGGLGDVGKLTNNFTATTLSAEQQVSEAAKLRLFEDKISAEGFDVPVMIEESPFNKTTLTPKKSYRFGLLTIGSRGDVQPYIALGKGLLAEGHRVTIISHGEFQDWVTSYGIDFREIAGNPAELMSLMVQHGSMNVGLLREASSHFRGWITKLLETAWLACQNLDILIESPSAMAGIHIAEALRIPYFRAFTMPWTRTRAYPHAFIVPDQKRGGNYNFFTHVLFENIFWKGIGGQVNKWRTETLGLGKTNLMLMQQNKVPFLYCVSPTIFPPSVDFSEWVKVTGYWFLEGEEDYVPPKALVDFIAKARSSGKKLVYIGFGSIVISDPKKMTKAIVDAILEADVFCILNKGWSDRLGGDDKSDTEALPSCIYSCGSVPHDWLFPLVDAAVHHGGSGTTGAALKAGLPTVVKPFFGDQFFYASRVEDIGAGISLKKLNSKTLSRALKEVTSNSRIVHKAQQIKHDIFRENGVGSAINCIYSELEYARSLVLEKNKDMKKTTKVGSSPEENSWLLV